MNVFGGCIVRTCILECLPVSDRLKISQKDDVPIGEKFDGKESKEP